MKLKKILTLTAAAVLGMGTASAATEITSGTKYYIQNVESGLFLCGANSWGTQGSVSRQGDLFTANVSNGKYALVDNDLSSGNKSLGTNLFTDSTGNNWEINAVDGEPGVFTIKNGSGYVAQSTTAGGHIGFTAVQVAAVADAAKWYFLTVEEAKAKLAATSWGSSTSASFLLNNANFGRNHNQAAWTVSSNCTNKNLCGGVTDNTPSNACAESYHSPFTISQTLDVPNGVYGVTAQGFVRIDGGTNTAVFFANEATQPFPLKTGTENSMTDASNSFSTGAYTIEEFKVTVTNGKLEIGVKNTSNALWCIWDNFNITYYGVDVTALQEALAGRITVAQAISGDMNAAVAAALADAITTAQAATATEESLTAALSVINPAIENAEASVAVYAAVAAKYNTLDAAGKAAFEATTNGAKYVAKTLVNEDCAADLAAAAKAQTTEGADMTLAIVNPTVDGITGWTESRPKGGNGPLLGGAAFEYWAGNANPRAEASFDYYQTITGLPVGKYRVSADMYNSLNSETGATWAPSAGLYGNNDKVLVDVEGATYNKYSVEVAVTNGTLRLGVKNFDKLAARWFCADNFSLTFLEAIKLQDFYDSIANLLGQTEAITSKQSAATASALDAAVAATEGYTEETDIEKLNAMIDGLTNALENSNASVAAYADLNTALASTIFIDRSAAFGTEFTYRTEAQTMYNEATASTEDAKTKADGMLNAYRNYVKGIADNYPTVAGVKGVRETGWEYTTNPQNNATFNNTGNLDINGNQMWENWRGSGLAVGDMKQTVTVPNGKYFLRLVSFTRNSPNANDYIYIKSGETIETSVTFGTSTNAFVNITNPIEVTNGKVEFGLHVGSGCDWAAIGGVVLYAMPEDVNRTTATDKYGTICLPYAFSATGATVYSAAINGTTVELTEVTTPVAGTPYIYMATADAQTFAYASGNIVTAPVAADPLVGVFTDTPAPVGSYVLQTQNEAQKFYIVADGQQPTVSANKAYLNVPASAAKSFAIGFADDVTAAGAINALIEGKAKIYNLNGHELPALQKGINIVNGVKVIVK